MEKSTLLYNLISGFPRGKIFFAEDLASSGLPPTDIRFYLSDLAAQGRIARLARGVWLFPELEEYSLKMRMPSVDTIVQAIARRESIRVAPCESQCAYLVGLTSIQTHPYRYITDGGYRRIRLTNQRVVELDHRMEGRIFTFKSEAMQRLTLGIRALGQGHITPRDRGVIREYLTWVSQEDFEDGLWRTPEWVRELLLQLRE